MNWFGKDWGAPVCKLGDHVSTPVGKSCLGCGDTIDREDNGVTLPHYGGGGFLGTVHYHHMCFMASVLPLTVHCLREGLPLCRFTTDVPRLWPQWHLWDDRESRVNCERCRALLVKS